jgi:hypothetical protein
VAIVLYAIVGDLRLLLRASDGSPA